MKRAAAARVKYRYGLGDGMLLIPPMHIGFHPLNRNGVGINAERCSQILREVLGQFDYNEACHDA
eukprot:1661009-Lingulodinium_polyedra.AAC.1